MTWRSNLTFALIGWLGGLAATLILGFSWPIIFPAIVNVEHYYGDGPGLFSIIGVVLLSITLPALAGGLIGSRVSIEGGARSQYILATTFGILFSAPFICMVLWFFTGF